MHPSYKEHQGKLNRVAGQVEAIKRMIDEHKYCVEILTQIRAARNALKAIELSILETHMKSCLDQVSNQSSIRQSTKIDEIMKLLKKYD